MPQVTARELVQFLRSQGFQDHRQAGSHLTLQHPGSQRLATVPIHPGADLGRGLVIKILKDAGFTSEDFLRLR
jgi:predicted RNA binding protein YcfA (HicA-like mRNA interferase family)